VARGHNRRSEYRSECSVGGSYHAAAAALWTTFPESVGGKRRDGVVWAVTTGQQWLAVLFGAGIVAVAIEASPAVGGAFLAMLVVAMIVHYSESTAATPSL
jgi:hypothetical protein